MSVGRVRQNSGWRLDDLGHRLPVERACVYYAQAECNESAYVAP
jgi:hypothetical protein